MIWSTRSKKAWLATGPTQATLFPYRRRGQKLAISRGEWSRGRFPSIPPRRVGLSDGLRRRGVLRSRSSKYPKRRNQLTPSLWEESETLVRWRMRRLNGPVIEIFILRMIGSLFPTTLPPLLPSTRQFDNSDSSSSGSRRRGSIPSGWTGVRVRQRSRRMW